MSEERQEFRWTEKAKQAALALADGQTRAEAATQADISERTLYRWLDDPDFSAEVDRLSLLTSIASRAERLRMAKRVARQKVRPDGSIDTDRDLLDWLKFAQGETDGFRVELETFAASFDIESCTEAELVYLAKGGDLLELVRKRGSGKSVAQ
jgi:hypothetical protein